MTPTPAPAPTSGSGFDQYLQTQGSTTGVTSSNGQTIVVGGTGGAFPAQYAGTAAGYPGLNSKQLGLTVPGTGIPADGPQTTVLAEAQNGAGGLYPTKSINDEFTNTDAATPDQTIQQLMDNLFKQSQSHPDAIAKLQDQLILGGYLDPRSSSYAPAGVVQPGDATWDAYSHLLLDSIRLNTPWQNLLDTHVQQQDGSKKFNLNTSTSYVNATNPQAAKLSLAQVMARDLGRQPTNAEIGQFAAYLSGQEQANPVVTTTHQDLSSYLNDKGGKSPHRSVTTSGGANPTASAETFDLANNGQEMAKTQADQVYDIFRQMLAGSG